MANRYWVGNGGNWTDTSHWSTISGGSGGASIPTSSDNVYFNANSFSLSGQTVNINTGANCLDMDWTNVSNNPSLSGNNYINVYGSLTLSSGMSMANIYAGIFYFWATTSVNITLAGKTCNVLGFYSSGTWTLQDDIYVNGYYGEIQCVFGTLNTNNKNISCKKFTFNGGYTRALTLGSSIITVSGDVTCGSSNATFDKGTSTFIMTGLNSTFTGAGFTFYNLELQNNIAIVNSNTFNQLKIYPSTTITFSNGTTQTVTDLYLGNNSIIQSSTNSNLIYNGTYIPSYIGYNISKTNITVTTPNVVTSNRYWVRGTGNWSNIENWSVFGGFYGGASVPIFSNNVYFNEYSFTGTGQILTIDLDTNCANMDWTGVLYSPTMYNIGGYIQNIYGSLLLSSNMIMNGTYSGNFSFNSTSTNKTITTAGKTCYSMYFDGSGGGWTLQDNVITIDGISLNKGILNTNGKSVFCSSFSSIGTNTRTLTLGSSIVTSSGNISFTSTNLTFNKDTSTFIMTGSTTTFTGVGLTFYNLELQQSIAIITGNNTFNNITLLKGITVKFSAGSTQTTSSFIALGTSSNNIIIKSTIDGNIYTLYSNTNDIPAKYCNIRDCVASGSANWLAFYSTNLSNNTGWQFITIGFSLEYVKFMGKSILDNVHAQNKELNSADIDSIDSTNPQTWGTDTNFLADYENTLEAGNVISSAPITGWRLKRKLSSESTFTTLKDFEKSTLSYIDKTTRNNKEYTYSLFTLSSSGEGYGLEATGTSEFWGWFLIDPTTNTSYKFDAMNQTDSIPVNIDMKIYNNYTQYPSVSYGKAKYRTGKLTTMPYSYSDITGEYTIDVDLLNNLKDFINNNNKKVLKNTLGEIFYVETYNFSYKFMDEIKEQIYTISFDWLEVDTVENVGV